MSKKGLVKLSLLGLGAYYLYKNREEIKAGFQDAKKNTAEATASYQAAKNSLANIKQQLSTIKDQTNVLTQVGKDLNYQIASFTTDTQARLTEIQKVTGKYDKTAN